MIRRLPVVFGDSAKSDLAELTEQIALASGSYRTAFRFVERIEARCLKIANAPRGGRARDDLAAGLRAVPFQHSAVITYSVEEDAILIVNIFYGGRDYESLIRPE